MGLTPLEWRVKGVLPAKGLAVIYGVSGTGKSFLGFDLAIAIQEGTAWFSHRVSAAPVIYIALEGEAGFKQRAQAWEQQNGRPIPQDFNLVLGGFSLTSEKDINDLAKVLPRGAVVFIDTLNRAAPSADENSSKDMGMLIAAAKHLQEACEGLVVLIHHSGKDSRRGMRGHSSLVATLDAAIEVTRNSAERRWTTKKTKEGTEGESSGFTLKTLAVDSDEFGEDITSCVVIPDIGTQFIQSAKAPQGKHQILIMQAVRDAISKFSAQINQPLPASIPKGAAAIALEASLPQLAGHLDCSSDKRTSRARAALHGLVAKGMLRLTDGWLWIP